MGSGRTHARTHETHTDEVLRCVALLAALRSLLLLLLLLGVAVGLGRCDKKKRGRETGERAGGQAGKAAGAGSSRLAGNPAATPQDPVGMVLYVWMYVVRGKVGLAAAALD